MPPALPVVLGVYLLSSLVAFTAMGLDKRAARLGRRRIAERTLHLIELLGGFPGSLLGQRVFRHKTRKASYVAVFWLVVLVHAAAWTWWWLRAAP